MLRRSLALSLAAGLALAGPSAARAEDPPEHRTVITPTRTESTPFDSDRAIFAIDREQLDALMPADVPEALGRLPGVSVQRTNRGAASPILRGLVGPQNLLLVDGVRLNTSIYRTGPNQYSALVDPGALGSVELLLGPSSVLYGSDAMGGTIGYRTLAVPTTLGLHGHAELAGESADLSARAAALVSFGSEAVKGWARASGRLHDTLRAGGGEEQPMSEFSQVDWATRWAFTLAPQWTLTAAWLGTTVPDAGRAESLPKGDVRQSDNLDNLGYLRLDHRASAGFLRELAATVSVHHMIEENARWKCKVDDTTKTVLDRVGCAALEAGVATPNSTLEDEVTALGFSATARGQLLDERLQLTLGLDGQSEWIGSARLDDPTKRGNFSDGSTYGMYGGFARVEGRPVVAPGVFELVVTGALRGTAVMAAADDVPGLGAVDYDHFGLTGGGSVRALLGERMNLYIGAWQGFRAPNLQETTVLGDTGASFEIPNADLSPEKSLLLEAGAKLFTADVVLGVALFNTAVDDAIVRESATWEGQTEVDGKKVYRRTNATEATYRGAELSLEAALGAGVRFDAQLSVIDGEVQNVDGTTVTPRRLPPFQGGAGLAWRVLPTLSVGADVRFAAGQTALHPEDEADIRICGDPNGSASLLDPCPGTEGWAEVGLGATWTPFPALTLRARVDNLLDDNYRVHGSGYDAAGINGKLSARYTF